MGRLGYSNEIVWHTLILIRIKNNSTFSSGNLCVPTFDSTLIDPYSSNPAIHSVFENYVLWKDLIMGIPRGRIRLHHHQKL